MAKPEFKRFTGTGGTFYEISESGVLVYQTETGHPNARRIYEATYDLAQAEQLYTGILESITNFLHPDPALPAEVEVSQQETQTTLGSDELNPNPVTLPGGTISIEPGEYKSDEIAPVIANEAAIGGDVTIAGGEQPALPAPAPAEEDTAAGGV